MHTIRHFTATTYVVYENKVLLHFHRNLAMWLPVGGHIEKNELPEEAAIREIHEEAGIMATLYNQDKPLDVNDVRQLIRPMHILLEDIENAHKHIDLIYYATSESDILTPQDGETADLKWFTTDEINTLDAPENVKLLALEAIELLKTVDQFHHASKHM